MTAPAPDPLWEEILAWSKAAAAAAGAEKLDTRHIILGALKTEAGRQLLSGLLRLGEDLDGLEETRRNLEEIREPLKEQKFSLTEAMDRIVKAVKKAHGPALRAEPILNQVLQQLRDVNELGTIFRLPAATKVSPRVERIRASLSAADALSAELSTALVGQDRAIGAVCEAFFVAQQRVQAGTSGGPGTRGPLMVFTFVGPPGVGKTYMAELIAGHLKKGGDRAGFLRLDMSDFAAPSNYEQLVGFAKAFNGGQRGVLTSFAEANPRGVVLVDELEKAGGPTINVFLQVLDAGRLVDALTLKEVDLSGMTFIFTTNLGRSLWDAPESVGFLEESRDLAETVLEALAEPRRSEDGTTQRSGLPFEILSRLSKGTIALFGRLGGVALEQLAGKVVEDVSAEMRETYGLELSIADPSVLTLLVLRFASGGDARRLTAGLGSFLHATVRRALTDHRTALLGGESPRLSMATGFRLRLREGTDLPVDVAERLKTPSRILVIDDDPWTDDVFGSLPWKQVDSREDADTALRQQKTDFVLLDLHMGASPREATTEKGQNILRWIRSRFPGIPVLVVAEGTEASGLSADFVGRITAEGGARGVLWRNRPGSISKAPAVPTSPPLNDQIRAIDEQIRRQRLIDEFTRRLKVLDFDTAAGSTPDAHGWIPVDLYRVREVVATTGVDRSQPASLEIPRERLSSIAGARQAKTRLEEIVRWLRNPQDLRNLGLGVPKGILLTGPPGTGKTSLARAVAGEANFPFFSLSGTSILTKWAGESERKVRELFASARRLAPSIIFIDEIDSIGGRRSGGEEGGSRWRDSVLNELLTQMDGFSKTDRPVLVLAATNRAEILDDALRRPGRFDATIEVPLPDLEAREALFALYLAEKTVGTDVDHAGLARRTIGLSGAEIRQVTEEAGFRALRRSASAITQRDLEEAVTDVRFGLSSERTRMDEQTRKATAIHEAGHLLAMCLLRPGLIPAQATILPRGDTLGFVENLRHEESHDQSLSWYEEEVRISLAGRAAEVLLLGKEGASGGCSSDLENASRVATLVIARFGLDEGFGLVNLEGLQAGFGKVPIPPGLPEKAAQRVAAWLGVQMLEVRTLLEARTETLNRMVDRLLAAETLYEAEIRQMLEKPTPSRGD